MTSTPTRPPADHPTPRRTVSAAERTVAVPPFTSYVHLVSIDPTRNRRRFWRRQWHPTLWEGRALLCIWGRIGTLGRVRVLGQADIPHVEAFLPRLIRRRLQHGYQLVDWQ